MSHTSLAIQLPNGKAAPVDIWDDGNIWITHPDTGIRVGIGAYEEDEGRDYRQPFVHVNTEGAVDAEVGVGPVLAISLNEADIYDVERTGPTENSQLHQLQGENQ